ncbi:MAG: hypothetical protein ABI680_02265, partial [Chthoniobacteraceae bacterium]
MSTEPHHHIHRKRSARLFLVGIFFLLVIADLALFSYAASEINPWRVLIGVLMGYSLSALLLLGAVWRRRPWARYVLIGMLWAMIAGFSLIALILGSRPELNPKPSLVLIAVGVVLMVVSNVWLIA